MFSFGQAARWIRDAALHWPERYNHLVLLYYITDRRQFAGTERQKRERLLEKIAEAARAGVDFIQLREKDLPPRELVELAREAVRIIREQSEKIQGKPEGPPRVNSANVGHPPTLLINSRIDVALAAGADGVHLTSTDIPASDARAVWATVVTRNAKLETRNCFIAVSCHTPAEVRLAEAHGADFAVFAPVFEKVIADGSKGQHRTLTRHSGNEGLLQLREACRAEGRPLGPEGIGSTRMPVLALGGITQDNAAACIEAGAAGVAGIRLFQDNDIAEITAKVRVLHRGLSIKR
jgi:thiamine-phosphate pyrophosphorylase